MKSLDLYAHYLAAKKTIDDRALNRNVWDALARTLPPATPAAPLRVLEAGAGIGTMLERLTMRGVLTHAIYTAIDADAESIAELHQRLLAWGARDGWSVTALPSDNPAVRRAQLRANTREIVVETQVADMLAVIADAHMHATQDVLIAHAFLDLLDLPRGLPALLALLAPRGLFYFTINFDGATIFEPAIDPAFDAEIERLYHVTMDTRVTNGAPAGDSRTGRHLFQLLRQANTTLIEAGSSDWVVFAGAHGFSDAETFFLHFIVDTVDHALRDHPALAQRRTQFDAWIAERHRQIEDGTLVYIAHQLDFIGRR